MKLQLTQVTNIVALYTCNGCFEKETRLLTVKTVELAFSKRGFLDVLITRATNGYKKSAAQLYLIDASIKPKTSKTSCFSQADKQSHPPPPKKKGREKYI